MEDRIEFEYNGKKCWIDKKELDFNNEWERKKMKELDRKVYDGMLTAFGLLD